MSLNAWRWGVTPLNPRDDESVRIVDPEPRHPIRSDRHGETLRHGDRQTLRSPFLRIR
ncbi:hypothetical protein [Spirulina major]|uniref:hypothetical protein n=1 Tax=Spirulina major TaxID=270636 RepID=UPI0015870483|nr:hypothetical protein [Spirulina major]